MDLIVGGVIGLGIGAGIIVAIPTIAYAVKLAPFLYANTRSAARAGMLFKKKHYEDMISAGSFRETLAILENTSYQSAAEHGLDFEKFSKALDKNMDQTYSWFTRIIPDDLLNVVKAMQMKYEINEIKRIYNALKNENDFGDVHVKNYELKTRLESVKDMQSFGIAFEGTKYEKIFSHKLDDYTFINTGLDKLFITNVFKWVKKVKNKEAAGAFKDYWRVMIDIFNLRAVLRKIKSKKDIELMPSGYLNHEELNGINDIMMLEPILNGSSYGEHITAMKEFDIEMGMYKYLQKFAGIIGANYSMQAGSIVKFLILKELEIKNLNIIAKLKSENFSDIAKYVVV